MLDLNRSVEQIAHQLSRVNARFPDALQLDKLTECAINGEVQVFPVGEVTVFCCRCYEDHAQIIAAAGDLKEILEALPYICDWYKERGLDYIELQGRCGWRRLLGDQGWRPTDNENELRKELN
jgi:hypothetical protein